MPQIYPEQFIGFWHPFGTHGGETREAIIARKHSEIKNNKGWTLWSFQNRTAETLDQWLQQIDPEKRVLVFCSDSPTATDPKGKVVYAGQYKDPSSEVWQNVPPAVRVPHPFGNKKTGCAFKVAAIHPQKDFQGTKTIEDVEIEWLSKDGSWRSDPLPTRGEYLVRPGGKARLRTVYVVLELQFPYIVSIT